MNGQPRRFVGTGDGSIGVRLTGLGGPADPAPNELAILDDGLERRILVPG